MKILIASDKFKGSLTAQQACNAIQKGIQLARPDLEINSIPVTDGGDGFAKLLTEATGGEWKQAEVTGPLGSTINAGWGWHPKLQAAWLDAAEVIGLRLVPAQFRNPLYTTTYGLGQLIRYISRTFKPKKITIGLGGSSTHDCGCGMAVALGYRFLDIKKQAFVPTGASLSKIDTILLPEKELPFHITLATDVNSLLLGPEGAAHQFSQQKGAAQSDITFLEESTHYAANKISLQLGNNPFKDVAGFGAAGGLGFGLSAFTSAKIMEGAKYIGRVLQLDENSKWADHIITGEGELDNTSFSGKITGYLIQLAQQQYKPATVFCGHASVSTKKAEVVTISLAYQSLEDNLAQAEGLLIEAARQWALSL